MGSRNAVIDHHDFFPEYDDGVLWNIWMCQHCEKRFVYNKYPGSEQGYWWTLQAWLAAKDG
jgi:hypothetical protein